MSNYWNLKCVTCNEVLPIGVNRGDKELRAIVRAALALAMLAEINAESEAKLEVTVSSAENPRLPLAWFKEHKGHVLSGIDEYGVLDGACGKDIKCTSCNQRKTRCTLPYNHEGDCS